MAARLPPKRQEEDGPELFFVARQQPAHLLSRSDLALFSPPPSSHDVSPLLSFPPPPSHSTVAMASAAVKLAEATQPKQLTGIDLYSRFAFAGAVCCSVTHGALTPVDV